MRIGINPVKNTYTKLRHKPHRIIMPIYIPNLEEDYFQNTLKVVKKSIDSIINTTDNKYTNITLINNGSCDEVDTLLTQYFVDLKIDRYIRQENRGKVEAVIKEARASYEEYITITDADVFFRQGWLTSTLEIFKSYKKAGMVSPFPTPNLFSPYNNAAIIENFFLGSIKKSSVVNFSDLKEFEMSIDADGLYSKYYKNQYHLRNHDLITMLGASHMVATYKNYLFQEQKNKVEYVFENGLEREFLDVIAQKHGLWRLGTAGAYVHHMGNSVYTEPLDEKRFAVEEWEFPKYKHYDHMWFWNSYMVEIFARIVTRLLRKTKVEIHEEDKE